MSKVNHSTFQVVQEHELQLHLTNQLLLEVIEMIEGTELVGGG